MQIKPSIRNNFFTNSHPLGCQVNVKKQIDRIKELGPFEGPKNVLIIGGSSGYGLGTRIALAYGCNANTVNVSFESQPRGKRTGSAGYWNNIFFQDFAKETGNIHKDFIGDAFSEETKQLVSDYIKEHLGSVDLVVYSLAAGARKNHKTGETVRSHIKSIGEPVIGKTIDIATLSVYDLEVTPATEQEIEDTVYVMGGSDWYDWVHFLDNEKLLSEGVKTIAYTYVGGPTNEGIYRKGSLGKAKEDLELKASIMDKWLTEDYHGEALISSSKGVVSKASVFIPQMPIYVSCLFDVMTKHGVHETIIEHKYRLFKDMVYGDGRIVDELGRIRIDHKEMDPDVQKDVNALMDTITDDNVLDLPGTKHFLQQFFQINGFDTEGIDYDADVDLDALLEQYCPEGL